MHLLVSELGHRNIFKMPPLTGNFTMCTFRLIQLAWGKVDDVKLCLIVETDRLARLGTALHNDVAANHNTSTIAITDSNTSHEMKDSLGFQDQPERERYVLAAWEWLRNSLSKKKSHFIRLSYRLMDWWEVLNGTVMLPRHRRFGLSCALSNSERAETCQNTTRHGTNDNR